MNKKIILLIGGSGKLGVELTKYLNSKYLILIVDKQKPKSLRKNSFFFNFDLESQIITYSELEKKIFLKNKNYKKNLCCVINLLRPNFKLNKDFAFKTKGLNQVILNYNNLINHIVKGCKNSLNILDISTTNLKLISQQNFEYHYFKNSMELLTKYNSLKLVKKKVYSNSLRIGLIKTKNLSKVVSIKNLKKVYKINQLVNYKNICDFIDKVYIDNKVLNGTTLTLDNSLSNIDPVYFSEKK